MLSARRPAPPRHEYRFGPQELVTCGAAFLLSWALTFGFGLLVGREFAAAERVAAELRGERNLNPFVTTRSRN